MKKVLSIIVSILMVLSVMTIYPYATAAEKESLGKGTQTTVRVADLVADVYADVFSDDEKAIFASPALPSDTITYRTPANGDNLVSAVQMGDGTCVVTASEYSSGITDVVWVPVSGKAIKDDQTITEFSFSNGRAVISVPDIDGVEVKYEVVFSNIKSSKILEILNTPYTLVNSSREMIESVDYLNNGYNIISIYDSSRINQIWIAFNGSEMRTESKDAFRGLMETCLDTTTRHLYLFDILTGYREQGLGYLYKSTYYDDLLTQAGALYYFLSVINEDPYFYPTMVDIGFAEIYNFIDLIFGFDPANMAELPLNFDSTDIWNLISLIGNIKNTAHRFNSVEKELKLDTVIWAAAQNHAHNYTSVVTKPTCTEGGYTTYTCSACGHSYTADETAPLGHNFGEWETTIEPTCTQKGEERKTCSRCGVYDAREIDALGHNYVVTVTEPTCLDCGYTTFVCSACGDSYVEDGPLPLGHDYEVTVYPATCTHGGYTVYSCKRCGDGYTDDQTLPIDHDYTSVVTGSTCTEGGYTTYTCTMCGDSYIADRIDPLGHNYVGEITTPATCVEEGTMTYTCTRCSDTYTEAIPAIGHNFVDDVCVNCGLTLNCPKAIVENINAKSGDDVSISVTLDNTPEIKSMAISDVTFNLDTLTLLGGEWNVDNSVISSWDPSTGKGVVTLSKATDLNGNEVFVLTFHVDDAADEGFYSISLKVSAKDKDNVPINITTVTGGITVRNYVVGDVNGDDEITDEDAIYLLFYTFFPEDYPVNQPCDFNGDGEVTDEDAIYILFYTFFPEDYPLH